MTSSHHRHIIGDSESTLDGNGIGSWLFWRIFHVRYKYYFHVKGACEVASTPGRWDWNKHPKWTLGGPLSQRNQEDTQKSLCIWRSYLDAHGVGVGHIGAGTRWGIGVGGWGLYLVPHLSIFYPSSFLVPHSTFCYPSRYLVLYLSCLVPYPYLVPHPLSSTPSPIWYPIPEMGTPTLTTHQSGILHSLMSSYSNEPACDVNIIMLFLAYLSKDSI